jgi:hypothetical protein
MGAKPVRAARSVVGVTNGDCRREAAEPPGAMSRWCPMPPGHDDLKDSFYLRIIRTSIGTALKRQVAVNEPLPDRLAELLSELDEPEDDSSPDGSTKAPPR